MRAPRVGPDMGEPDLHLAVALDGAGWHPASWREPDARPRELFTAGYWADLVAEAERGLLDFVTIEDSLGLQSRTPVPAGRPHRPGPRPARRRAHRRPGRPADPAHRPGADRVATHTEPFHVSKAIATLDYVSTGRAGVRVQISHRPDEAALFGRRTVPPGLLDDDATRPRWPSSSTRPPTTSRSSAGCGTAGRTTPRSATPPPAGSSTATSCTTSTSRAAHFSRQGPVDHAAAAAGPAARRRARPPRRRRTGSPPAPPTSSSSPRATPPTPRRSWPTIRAEQDAAGRGGDDRCTSSPTSWSSSTSRRRPPRTARSGSTSSPAREYVSDARDLHRHAGRAGRPARWSGRRPGLTGFRLRPGALPARPRRDHPRPGARAAAPRRVPHRLRGRHPARAARPAPPRQPLRRRLTGGDPR